MDPSILHNIAAPVSYVHEDYSQWERRQPRGIGRPAKLRRARTSLARPAAPRQAQVITKRHSDSRLTEDTLSTRIVKLQILGRRRSIANYTDHANNLQFKNMQLITGIQESDDATQGDVSQTLQKYHKFKNIITMLRYTSDQLVKEGREEIEALERKSHNEQSELLDKIAAMEKMITKKADQLQVLQHYKEKEYPLKLLQAEQLQSQLEYLDDKLQQEEENLKSATEQEREKFEAKLVEHQTYLETRAAHTWLGRMKQTALTQAVDNQMMKKEIELHEKHICALTEDNDSLREGIRRLKSLALENSRNRSKFNKLSRLCPEGDLHLDIVHQKELPI